MRKEGLEPSWFTPLYPKSSASANSATFAKFGEIRGQTTEFPFFGSTTSFDEKREFSSLTPNFPNFDFASVMDVCQCDSGFFTAECIFWFLYCYFPIWGSGLIPGVGKVVPSWNP